MEIKRNIFQHDATFKELFLHLKYKQNNKYQESGLVG